MYLKDVTVQNQVGLHARPATFFIQKANEYKSTVWSKKRNGESTPKVCWVSFLWESSAVLPFGSLLTAPMSKPR